VGLVRETRMRPFLSGTSTSGKFSLEILGCSHLPSVTDALLWELMLQVGPVERVYLPIDTETCKKKGYTH
jgi:hypothetical protein